MGDFPIVDLSPDETAPRSPRCRGIYGFMFGHKFIWSEGFDMFGPKDRCQRCGYKP